MDFRTLTHGAQPTSAPHADALLLVLTPGQTEGWDGLVGGAVLKAAVDAGDLKLERGQSLYLGRHGDLRLAAVVAQDTSPRALKQAMGLGWGCLKAMPVKHLAVQVVGAHSLGAAQAEALGGCVGELVYLYRATKPSAPPPSVLERLTLVVPDEASARETDRGLARAQAIGEGVRLAREVANRPGNHGTPSQLAAEARKLAKAHGLKVEVLDRKAIEALGMGCFLAVAQGSAEPPRFIVLHYRGAPKKQAPFVLVGKGITFDSGGISIKPAAEMDEMKFDKGGAASVLGTFRALAQLRPRLNVVGLIPATENLPSDRAVKPGDVVTSLSGQTVEILNTDAEGRLILCDALTYAERFKPAAIVDIATLTGACVIALGGVRSGMFSNDDTLAEGLLSAGEAALDPCWRMPLDEEYDEGLKTSFADVANVGSRAAGAVTAAKFLQRFVKGQRWAHLDIAGTAWRSGVNKGATGRPVALLTHWLLAEAERGSRPAELQAEMPAKA